MEMSSPIPYLESNYAVLPLLHTPPIIFVNLLCLFSLSFVPIADWLKDLHLHIKRENVGQIFTAVFFQPFVSCLEFKRKLPKECLILQILTQNKGLKMLWSSFGLSCFFI